MRRTLIMFCCASSGCGAQPDPAPGRSYPDSEMVIPQDLGPPAIPEPDPHSADCPTHYTSDDANVVFGAMRNMEEGACTFDGVRAGGSRLTLTWKKEADTRVTITLGPSACVEGTVVGAFAWESDTALAEACPAALAALRTTLEDGSFPSPTGTLQLGSPGPDGAPKSASTPAAPRPAQLPEGMEPPPSPAQ